MSRAHRWLPLLFLLLTIISYHSWRKEVQRRPTVMIPVVPATVSALSIEELSDDDISPVAPAHESDSDARSCTQCSSYTDSGVPDYSLLLRYMMSERDFICIE